MKTMKKIYIQPALEEIKISTTTLLSGSETQELKTGTASEWASREGRGFWDDEDEY